MDELGIIEDYKNGIKWKEIYKKYNVSRKIANKILKKHNIKRVGVVRMAHDVDHEYFKDINTEDKAYFLGLMYADGCLPTGYKADKKFVIRLANQDKDILKKFKHHLKFSGPLYFRNPPKGTNNVQAQVELLVYSPKNREHLVKHGCTPRKTFSLQWPETVPDHLIRHFIRGFMDGDGYISYSEANKSIHLGFISTDSFCESLREYISKIFAVKGHTRGHRVTDGISTTTFSGTTKVIEILDWLYKDATVYLDRKYHRYIRYKKRVLKNQEEYLNKCRARTGTNNPNSKINLDTVLGIREMYDNGIKVSSIASHFKVSPQHARSIGKRKIWSGV